MNAEFHFCDACDTWVYSDERWLREIIECIADGRHTMSYDAFWYKVAMDGCAPNPALIVADFIIGNHDRRGQVLRQEALDRASSSRVFRQQVNGKTVFCVGSLYHESTCHYGPYEGEECDPRLWAINDLLELLGNPWG